MDWIALFLLALAFAALGFLGVYFTLNSDDE